MASVLAAGKDVNLRIVADKNVKGSIYILKVTSPIAKAAFKAEYEVFEEEPKLSKIMAYSALRALKAVLEGVEVIVV
jgi:predicted dinucleotide-utilizing enzyme